MGSANPSHPEDLGGRRAARAAQVSILGIPDDVPVRFDNPAALLPARIKGKSLSIFARHEGRTYLADLRVFKDGTSVPDGREISVHGLGAWVVRDGHWSLSPQSLRKRVEALVKELNPKLENLYDCHGRTSRLVGKGRCSFTRPRCHDVRHRSQTRMVESPATLADRRAVLTRLL
jgi:hypothetical protein